MKQLNIFPQAMKHDYIDIIRCQNDRNFLCQNNDSELQSSDPRDVRMFPRRLKQKISRFYRKKNTSRQRKTKQDLH